MEARLMLTHGWDAGRDRQVGGEDNELRLQLPRCLQAALLRNDVCNMTMSINSLPA